jgi:hypothetical protein
MNEDLLLRFASPDSTLSLVLEDKGRVAYAYLLQDDRIVGDVWLYNVAETPEEVDWRDPSHMPFLNPRRFCSDERIPPLTRSSNVSCCWLEDGVEVVAEGSLLARLRVGGRPGQSRLAGVAGPFAKPLEDAG